MAAKDRSEKGAAPGQKKRQLRWRRDALQPPERQRVRLDRITCAHVLEGGLRCATWNTRGPLGSPSSSQSSRETKHNYFIRLTRSNDIICLQEIHGEDEFLQVIQVFAQRLKQYGTFIPKNANAGGSAVCIHMDFLPDDAMVTHVVTCQGRDHVVSLRSGCRSLVVINVHFEPELTLRSQRERLRLITPHWPLDPEAIGVNTGDFIFCEPEEGRFNVWNRGG